MFQLTIKRESGELSHTFDQARLLAGSQGELKLSGTGIVPSHFTIFSLHGAYFIENISNDPTLRLNGNPLWKSRLRDNDTVNVGDNQITFKLLKEPHQESFEPPKPAVKFHSIHELQRLDIPSTHPLTIRREQRVSRFFKELGTYLIEKLQTEKRDSKWHVFALFFGFGITFLSLFCLVFYITVSQKSETQRLIAARGLSDIAVTLSYAKMQQLKPPNLNWINRNFIQETSKNVIPDSLTSRNWILDGGIFAETPYLLRIYSDSQLNRFLLIAQPRANFVQWLIPNSTIVVDSNTMIMREIPLIKELNRLLLNANGFDEENQKEIIELIEKQKPLSLRALAKNEPRLGFTPPEELSMINHELELYLYNAPRYYLWNQLLVNKANLLSQQPNNSEETLKVSMSLEKRFPYKGMILYTNEGIETAINARRAMSDLGHEYPFYVGYLTLSKNGLIDSSHVLIKSSKPWALDASAQNFDEERSLPQLPGEIAELTKNPFQPFINLKRNFVAAQTKKENIPLHPLLIELSILLKERENAIKPHLEPLVNLLTDHVYQSDRQFFIRHKQLFANYEAALREQQEVLDHKIDALHEKYVIKNRTVSLPQFLAFLDQKGIDMGYEEDSFLLSISSTEEQIHTLLALIEDTQNILVLDQAALEAHDLITTDEQKEQLRTAVLYKLEQLLWKPNLHKNNLPPEEELRWIVGRILKNGHITQREAREFYLSNFLE